MEPTTSGRFRLFESPRDEDERLLVEVSSCEPTYVDVGPHLAATARAEAGDDASEHDGTEERARERGAATSPRDATDLDRLVSGLRPGYVVDATLAWRDGVARFTDVSLVERTLVSVVADVEGLFDAARETCQAARDAGEPMESRVTRDTDGEPNGVVYVFADGDGAGDTFEEFRRGAIPIEPLVQRVADGRDDDNDREVFVMRPVDEPFVVVYLTFEKGGLLANTVRDTYDCPRPSEPLTAPDALTAATERDSTTPAGDRETPTTNGHSDEATRPGTSTGTVGDLATDRTSQSGSPNHGTRQDAAGDDATPVDPWGDGDDDWLNDDPDRDPWGDDDPPTADDAEGHEADDDAEGHEADDAEDR
jgi:hypothetical protein